MSYPQSRFFSYFLELHKFFNSTLNLQSRICIFRLLCESVIENMYFPTPKFCNKTCVKSDSSLVLLCNRICVNVALKLGGGGGGVGVRHHDTLEFDPWSMVRKFDHGH